MSKPDPYTQHILGLIKTSDGLITRPKIDYVEFREKWLPLFNAASNDGLAPLGEWVQCIARGNPFMPVDVIQGGHIILDELYPEAPPGQPPFTTIEGGKLMFTVPPILNNQIQVSLKDGRGVDNVAIQADAMSKRMAVAGERYLQKNLIDNLKIDVPVDPELSKKMDKIFEHFGIRRTHQIDNVTEESKPIEIKPEEQLSNDDFNYDY